MLTFHHHLGIESYPTSDGLKSFLAAAKSVPPPKNATATPKAEEFPTPPILHQKKEAQPTLPTDDTTLEEIRLELGDCQRCGLNKRRAEIIFGTGAAKADLFIIGEWPDHDEEKAGKPFQGANGALLDRMLQAIGMSRDQVYLTNIVKCRPEQDQPPGEKELKACRSFLIRQIAVINPKVILTMGPLATGTLLKNKAPLSRLRGRFHSFRGIDLMPTFHPSFLIANTEMKKATWVDLQMVQKRCARK